MARSAQTCLSDRVGTGTKIRNHRNTLDKQQNSLNHVEAAELQTTGVGVHVRRDHSNHPNHQSLATFSFPSPLIYHCLPPAPVHDYDLGLACSIIKKWQTSLVPNRRTGHILESGWQHRLVRNRYQIQLSRIWSLLVYSLRCLVCLLYYIAWCLSSSLQRWQVWELKFCQANVFWPRTFTQNCGQKQSSCRVQVVHPRVWDDWANTWPCVQGSPKKISKVKHCKTPYLSHISNKIKWIRYTTVFPSSFQNMLSEKAISTINYLPFEI